MGPPPPTALPILGLWFLLWWGVGLLACRWDGHPTTLTEGLRAVLRLGVLVAVVELAGHTLRRWGGAGIATATLPSGLTPTLVLLLALVVSLLATADRAPPPSLRRGRREPRPELPYDWMTAA